MYIQAALLAHDCIGNTFITVDNNKQLKVYASVDIQAGEIIYNNYTASLYVSGKRYIWSTQNMHRSIDCEALKMRTGDGYLLNLVYRHSGKLRFALEIRFCSMASLMVDPNFKSRKKTMACQLAAKYRMDIQQQMDISPLT